MLAGALLSHCSSAPVFLSSPYLWQKCSSELLLTVSWNPGPSTRSKEAPLLQQWMTTQRLLHSAPKKRRR